MVFSPDASRLVSGSTDATLKVWETANGLMIHTLQGKASSAVYSIAFSPDRKHVVSSADDASLHLWDAATWQLVRTFPENPEIAEFVKSTAFSPDGGRVVSGGGVGGMLRLWDIESGRLLRTFEGHSNVVASTAFSPDGARVLSGSWDGTLKLWDTESGKLLRTFERHSGWVNSVKFSPDGRRLLSGGSDKKINLWDAETGQLVRSLEGHAYKVNSVAFSPDGARIISGSADASARIWNANTGELLVTLIGTGNGEWFSITPEGFFNAASPQAAKLLAAVRGLDVFSIDQFWQSLYRPDLVKEKLGGDPLGKVKEAAAKLDLDKILDSGLAPRVAITSHKRTGSSLSDLITVAADFLDAGGGIGKVEWRINGITVGVSEVAVGNSAPAKIIQLKQDIALDPGDNTIEVVAYNAAGLVASIPAKTRIKWTGTQPSAKPRLHVLAIGINDYYEGKLRLKFGVPDATSFADGLREAGKDLYEEVSVTTALDKDATATHLNQIFEDLKTKIRPRDVFVFYAAGHGKTEDGRYYFVPQDFRYEAGQTLAQLLAARGIGQDRLQKWFSLIPARKSIVILDTCESGTLAGDHQVALNTRGGLEQLAAVGRLIQATGRTTLTAAMDDQPAREGYRGHGVFTFALLDALARGDRSGNGLIEVTELLEHVDGLVPEITDKTWHVRQIPRSLFQGSNFALTKQLPSLNPAPGEEMIISTVPTHVVSEIVEVLKDARASGAVVQKLQPFTTVTLVKTEAGWALVAKGGKALGFIAAEKLHTIQ